MIYCVLKNFLDKDAWRVIYDMWLRLATRDLEGPCINLLDKIWRIIGHCYQRIVIVFMNCSFTKSQCTSANQHENCILYSSYWALHNILCILDSTYYTLHTVCQTLYNSTLSKPFKYIFFKRLYILLTRAKVLHFLYQVTDHISKLTWVQNYLDWPGSGSLSVHLPGAAGEKWLPEVGSVGANQQPVVGSVGANQQRGTGPHC